jgi:hypothetical protein
MTGEHGTLVSLPRDCVADTWCPAVKADPPVDTETESPVAMAGTPNGMLFTSS